MKNISKIKLISIDLFRTLVPLPQSPEYIRQWFLEGRYPEELVKKYEQRSEEILARRWDTAGKDDRHFLSVRKILEDTLAELFQDIHLDMDVKQAADKIMVKHNPHQLFDDVKPFLDTAGKKYPICLSSDCDLNMITDVLDIYPFDAIFASEELKVYKLNPRFFRCIMDHYHLTAEEILHIGDSKSDIIIPEQLGLVTCWLNRKNKTWDHPIKPDYEVKSLLEILGIPGLK